MRNQPSRNVILIGICLLVLVASNALQDKGYFVAVHLKIRKNLGFVLRNIAKRGFGFELVQSDKVNLLRA